MENTLIGKRFGRLVVTEYAGNDLQGKTIWLCKCDCGSEKEIIVREVNLKNNRVKSCGCLTKERLIKFNKDHSGKNSYRYNPDLSDEERYKKHNICFDYSEWAREVKEKDNFICQICGQIGGALVSHHLNSFNIFPDERTNINNGTTLCLECHKEFHSIYGYGGTNKDDFEDFIDFMAS